MRRLWRWRPLLSVDRERQQSLAGSVAVEAAIAIPGLFLALILVIDTVRYLEAAARVQRAAALAADLVTRNKTAIDRTDFEIATYNNELGMVLLAANAAAEPSDLVEDGRVILSAIRADGAGFSVYWSRTSELYELDAESRLDEMPPLPTGSNYVVAEVFLDFEPLAFDQFWTAAIGQNLLYDHFAYRPRLGGLTELDPVP